MKKVWPFSYYFFYFAAIAFVSPFMVLYFQELGFTGSQIGLITGITPLVTFVSVPFWTGLADVTGKRRWIMNTAMLVGVVGLAVYPFARTFPMVFALAITFNIFFASVSSFADSATMYMLGEEKDLYGRVRSGGTIGFGIMATVSGALVQNYGLKIAYWGAALMIFLGFIVSQKMVHDPEKTDRTSKGGARLLLVNPRWLLFLTIAFTGGLSISASNTYFYPYMKELGASESIMGLSLTIGTIVEIPVLLFINKMINRYRSYNILMFSMVITGIRLLLFAVSGRPEFVLFIQVLNGFTFPVMWVAGVAYAAENAPAGMKTTAQGVFGAMVMGIGTAVGGFTGGLLLSGIGGRGLFLVFGIAVFAILGIVTLLQRRLPDEQQPQPVPVVK